MALKKSYLFIFGLFLVFSFSRCDKTPSDSEPEDPQIPASVNMTAPLSTQTYWDDKPLSCEVSISGFSGEEPEWFIDGESVVCVDSKFAETPPAGEHTVKVAIGSGDSRKEVSSTITVKEGFSVTLDKPKSGAEFFVGDEVSCSATITPEKYEEHLQITIDGKGCTVGKIRLEKAGELTVRAFATIDGRTEADEATIVVKPVIAGKVYPLTSDGVQNGAGFSVTLRAGGEVLEAQTDADGNFVINPTASVSWERRW